MTKLEIDGVVWGRIPFSKWLSARGWSLPASARYLVKNPDRKIIRYRVKKAHNIHDGAEPMDLRSVYLVVDGHDYGPMRLLGRHGVLYQVSTE